MTDWNTLFHCIFWQVGTPCFIIFFGRLKHVVSLNCWRIGTPCFIAFFVGWNTLFRFIVGRLERLVLLHFVAHWNTLFHCIFLADWNPFFYCIVGRLERLVSLHFFCRLEHFVSLQCWQIVTHCFITFFGTSEHLVSLYFLTDWNTYIITYTTYMIIWIPNDNENHYMDTVHICDRSQTDIWPPYTSINVGIWQSYMCLLKHIYAPPYMSMYCWYMMLIYVCHETHICSPIYEYVLLVYDDHIWVFPHNPNRHMTLIYEYFTLVYDTHICVFT